MAGNYDHRLKGRPVKLRLQGHPKRQEAPSCALTVPAWIMRESDLKLGDSLVPSIEGDKIVYTRTPPSP